MGLPVSRLTAGSWRWAVGRLGAELVDGLLVMVDHGVHAGEECLLGIGAGDAQCEVLERTDLGDELQQEGEDAGAEAGALVAVAEALLVVGLVLPVDQLLGHECGLGLLHLLAVVGDGDLGHLRQQAADGLAIGADGEVFVGEDQVEGQAVGVLEGAFEDRLGDLRSR